MNSQPLSDQYTELSRHRKVPSATSSTIDEVEAFAKAKGIIDLDNPEVKKKTVISDLSNFELARYKAKKELDRLEAEAQENYKKALYNIKDGTAVHRVKHERTKPAKKTAKKAHEPSTQSREANRKSKKPKIRKFVRDIPTRNEIAQARREAIVEKLKAGGRLVMLKQPTTGYSSEYQQQQSDIRSIIKNTDIKIVRISSIKTDQSYFVIDDFERYQADKKISSRLVKNSGHDLLKAVCSRQLLQASDIAELNKDGSRAMATLARKYDFDIHTVLSSNVLIGWVLIESTDKTFDAVKERQGLKLMVAFEYFKKVAQDTDTTIAEVLAIKDGQ
ncbi:hypothetical protein [Psychrobacter sp. PAMC 21119]|uniref:hypothetical protein n=1 Tax=Psychrobacter sp. PAMC 21119 TaxID=1112209 RepID=UPI000289A0D5|nr:hypothetical protein [Psychrobacter sp. PAMC 21119]